jgi:hypothetical protein
MIFLNFSHPLTPAQQEQLEALLGQAISTSVEVRSQIDPQAPLSPQIQAMADAAGLSMARWQSEAIVINLPALNHSAATLLAELHGRMGYFPPCLRLRPVPDALPPRYEVAEVMNLQTVRDAARRSR